MKILRKLHSFFRRKKLDAEMAEEMRQHVELQVEQNIAVVAPMPSASVSNAVNVKPRDFDNPRTA